MVENRPQPTLRERLQALAAFLPRFEAPDFVFGTWHSGEQNKPDVFVMPYVEPGETALAENTQEPEIEGGPPLRPEDAIEGNETLASFAEEVNRSWERLAEQTQPDTAGHSASVSQASVDDANITMPPDNSSSFAGTASPLTPRAIPEGSAPPSSAPTGEFQPPAPTQQPSTSYENLADSTFSADPPSAGSFGAGSSSGIGRFRGS